MNVLPIVILDWTLLVDGFADPAHTKLTGEISKRIYEPVGLKNPGGSGMFGQITFSHDLIHYIGGDEDTNHNISRRILILLESDYFPLGNSSGQAYSRVLKGVINAYIDNDSGFRKGYEDKLPRFLLNDIIRFWRTICVDFAYKQKAQNGQKWAIRNIKLGLSRKLIYLKGLLMCYECLVQNTKDAMIERLLHLSQSKPLDVLVEVLENANVAQASIFNLLQSYDDFIGILSDTNKRQELSKLELIDADNNKIFSDAKNISRNFQTGLHSILMDNKKLNDFILKYTIL